MRRLPLLLLASASLLPLAAADEKPDFDVLITGGRVIDGTGNPWSHGDVAIKGDRIAAVGRVKGKAKLTIDAKGKVVAPGFIDVHSHSDYHLLEDGSAQSKIHQGVTTDVLGEGRSVAPNKGELKPRTAKVKGKEMSWDDLKGYFAALEKGGSSVNVATYVGLDNVWLCVMGSSHERPSKDQLAKMQKLVEESMEQGAFGLSSMLAMPPGSLAKTDEIILLAKAAAKHGGIYSSHIRNEGIEVIAAVKEAIEIGEKAGLRVDVIHLKIADQKLWGKMNELVALIEAARKRGVDVQANVYPYTRGHNNLASIVPPWAHEGGTAKMLQRLKDDKDRARIKKDVKEGIDGWYNHYTAVGGDWSRVLLSGPGKYSGLTMDRVLAARKKDKKSKGDDLDAFLDLLVEQGGSVPAIYEHHTEKDMRLALQQPWCSVGSDGLAYSTEGTLRRGHPHPRSFGTFPRVLGVYVRELKALKLEDAVRKMTSLNASKVGIRDRGLLRKGCYADVVVFDEGKITDRATYTEPFQYAEGVEWVLVNGVVVLEKGKHTGARPGRGLRRGE
jgi:N-acyl-D-aspartate/D-glutamate deacylase